MILHRIDFHFPSHLRTIFVLNKAQLNMLVYFVLKCQQFRIVSLRCGLVKVLSEKENRCVF